MPSTPETIQVIAAVIFAAALLHTFAAKQFERLSHRFPRHAGLFHLLGEVEVVFGFGFWAIVLVLTMALLLGGSDALAYAEFRNCTEPLFVFVVMAMVIAASRPVLRVVMASVNTIAERNPLPTALATAWLGLAAVPRPLPW